jgi:hypothetical protein
MSTRRGLGTVSGAGLLLALLVVFVGPVAAACRITMNCSTTPCESVQECDSALDSQSTPTPQSTGTTLPPGVDATQGDRVLSPRPSPPPGTSQCRPAYVCDGAGRCNWQTVCY